MNKLTNNLHESNDILHSPYKRIDWKTYLDAQHCTGHLVLVELIQSGIGSILLEHISQQLTFELPFLAVVGAVCGVQLLIAKLKENCN